MVKLFLDGFLLLEHHRAILLKLVIECRFLALKFHKLLKLQLLVGIYLDLMLFNEPVKLGLDLLGYLRLVRLLLKRISFLGNTGLFCIVELLYVTFQVGVCVVKFIGLRPHQMLQSLQVPIGLIARLPIRLVNVLGVFLVDPPSFDFFLAQVAFVLFRPLLPLGTAAAANLLACSAALNGAAPGLARITVFSALLFQPALVRAAA